MDTTLELCLIMILSGIAYYVFKKLFFSTLSIDETKKRNEK